VNELESTGASAPIGRHSILHMTSLHMTRDMRLRSRQITAREGVFMRQAAALTATALSAAQSAVSADWLPSHCFTLRRDWTLSLKRREGYPWFTMVRR
jgi:hypothetical protein